MLLRVYQCMNLFCSRCAVLPFRLANVCSVAMSTLLTLGHKVYPRNMGACAVAAPLSGNAQEGSFS